MSYQVFLQGKIVGTEQFVSNGSGTLLARSQWASLLSEVLPRALLAELGLSPMLLGSSGGDQFLLVFPSELQSQAEAFLRTVNTHVDELTAGWVRIAWSATENLGSWSDIHKRLENELRLRLAAPGNRNLGVVVSDSTSIIDSFTVASSETVGWSPEQPGVLQVSGGKHTWRLGNGTNEIPLARHAALDDAGQAAADPTTLGSRAAGQSVWGVLRGDVDNVAARLELAQNIEEHLQLSLMLKQFFAGELQMLCSQPEFFQKVSLLRCGADDFAVYGAWDALISLARELQRIYALFVDANLRDYAGMEGKTISMGISFARPYHMAIEEVYIDARHQLERAKSSGKDAINVFGRTLEWKQLSEAAESRETMTSLIRHGASPRFLSEIADFYREADRSQILGGRGRTDRLDRPWRFYRRLNEYLGQLRGKESQRLRAALIDDFTGRRAKQIRLRPQERVALEWAYLELEQVH